MLLVTLLTSIYFATVGLAIASFTARRAYGSVAVMAFFLLPLAASRMAQAMVARESRKYTRLVSPFDVLEGVRNWIYDAQPAINIFAGRPRRRPPPALPDPLEGEIFLYVLIATGLVATAALLLRYRRTEG
jgi:hypothetical protein